MKYLILIGDGMADHPLPQLDQRTPLEAANTPALDEVVRRGAVGLWGPIPEGMPAGSEIGILSTFGYDPRAMFRGRAPMEAANQGIDLGPNQAAFRANLVTLEGGIMKDFTAGHITTDESTEIGQFLNGTLGREFPVHFHPGVGYRLTGVFTSGASCSLQELLDTAFTPPHNIMDQPYAPHLANGPAAGLFHRMMERSGELLEDHPVNRRRAAAGQATVTSIWPWGQGVRPEMPTYREKFGISGAVVSAVDLINGIGVLAGLEIVRVPGVTGWIDTNYDGKREAGLAALDRHPFSYIHLEAPDEAAHQGRADLKIQAIESFDQRIVAPALEYLDRNPDTRVFVAPDHFTLVSTKGHAPGPVPFAVCGVGIQPDENAVYTEARAQASGILEEDGYALVERFLTEKALALRAAVSTR